MPGSLPGQAFLALWNDRAPGRADYDEWHSREHVPERLRVPGILSARRYAEGSGPLPSYLTLYALADLAVLASAPYRTLLDNPTPWSRSMRPDLRNFLRVGCRTAASVSSGTGGLAAARFIDLRQPEPAAALPALGAISATAGVCGVHFGMINPAVAGVPFAAGPSRPLPGNAVLIVEGYAPDTFDAGLAEIDTALTSGPCRVVEGWSRYRLAFVAAG